MSSDQLCEYLERNADRTTGARCKRGLVFITGRYRGQLNSQVTRAYPRLFSTRREGTGRKRAAILCRVYDARLVVTTLPVAASTR